MDNDLLEAILEGYFASNPLTESMFGINPIPGQMRPDPIGNSNAIYKGVASGSSTGAPSSNFMGGTKSHRDYGEEARNDKSKYRYPTLKLSKKTADTIDSLIKHSKAPNGIGNYSLLKPQYHSYQTPGFSSQPVHMSMNSQMGF